MIFRELRVRIFNAKTARVVVTCRAVESENMNKCRSLNE